MFVWEFFVRSTRPVSYTHLDVYKRQDLSRTAMDSLLKEKQVRTLDVHMYTGSQELLQQSWLDV